MLRQLATIRLACSDETVTGWISTGNVGIQPAPVCTPGRFLVSIGALPLTGQSPHGNNHSGSDCYIGARWHRGTAAFASGYGEPRHAVPEQ